MTIETASIPVIDLFAGPGGLNEGFSQLQDSDGNPIFTTVGSFEMDPTAVKTLTLRDMFRHMDRNGGVPDSYYKFICGELAWDSFVANQDVSAALEAAQSNVHQVELGSDEDESNALIRIALENAGALSGKPWVLIGGPPCQAYSLAGRSRRANDDTFAEDKKHFLYREYLRIIREFEPSVFVMENVKGLLSSTTTGVGMFDLIKRDLEHPGGDLHYDVHSLTTDKDPSALKPRDFIIKSEQFGIPQKRHRVILVGTRHGFFPQDTSVGKLEPAPLVTVKDALSGLPRLRSGISPASLDSLEAWVTIRNLASAGTADVRSTLGRGGESLAREGEPADTEFAAWVIDRRLDHVIQHHSRTHMTEDLKRYWFAASEAKRTGTSPKLRDYPPSLLPNHKNADSDSPPFEDRFRVQLENDASTTVVSHIAKDGHYYIHPDPAQMRSLTVREAARLQSFPDNYFFMGSQTQQYHQVGNAVPPLLANQIAKIVQQLVNRGSEPLSTR